MQVPKVLAAVFAVWTIDFYQKTHDPNSSDSTAAMRSPHAVQVFCILRLLGAFKSGKMSLENHLAEVPTGEGKSVVLAVCAATLALYGYHVDCVCYSENLSGRDNAAFEHLFQQLGSDPVSKLAVKDMIRYAHRPTLPSRLVEEA